MRNPLLLFFVLLISFNAFTQQAFFHSEVTPWVGKVIDVYPDDDLLYQVRIGDYNQFVIIKQFNNQYQPLKEIRIFRGIDCIRDDSGNFYALIANDFDWDIGVDPVPVTIEKYDANLELIYKKIVSIDSSDNWQSDKIGKFIQLPDGKILIVYADRRIIFDTTTEEFTSEKTNDFIQKVKKIEILNDNQLLIEENGFENNFHVTDYEGIILENVDLEGYSDWSIYKNHLYTAQGSELSIFDLSFNKLTSHTLTSNLNNFHLSENNSLLVCGKDKIYELVDEQTSPSVYFQNDYTKETLTESFFFAGEMGLSAYENMNDVSHPDHGNITTRKAIPIDPNELTNIGIEILSTNIIYTDSMEESTYGWSYWSEVLLEVEIENKGNFPIESIYYLTEGNCYQYPYRPDYCAKGTKENINILPNEKVIVEVYSELWDWIINIDHTYDICLSVLSPNQLYDTDYTDNQSCETVVISNTKSLSSPPLPLSLSPNPAQNILQLSFSTEVGGKAQLSLFDSQGRLVLTQANRAEAGQNQQQLDIAQLPAGLYLINITTGNQMFVNKLVKM